jgi:hypothetical protein
LTAVSSRPGTVGRLITNRLGRHASKRIEADA